MGIRAMKSILSVMTVVTVSLALTVGARAQSADWNKDWASIKTLYDDEGDYERAMTLLDQKLQSNGADFSDVVLGEMIEFIKFFFPGVSSDSKLFERVLFNMLSAGRVDRVTGAFSGVASLQQNVAAVKARWAKPTSARVSAGAQTLSIGETTQISVTTYNEKRATVPATGLRYAVSPSGRATWDEQTKLVTARAAGVFKVAVSGSDGTSLGNISITVGEPRAIARAEFYVDAEILEVGKTATYSLVVYDQKDVKIDAPSVTISASPEGAASVDRQSRKITVLQPGKVTIAVTKRTGEPLASAEIDVPEPASVSLTPDFGELEVNGKTAFTIKSNRPLKDVGVTWELETKGIVTAKETGSDETSVSIEVRSSSVGSTALIVKDGAGKRLARSPINVKKALALALPAGPSPRNLLISGGVTAGLGIVYFVLKGGADTKFDDYSACVTLTDPCLDLYNDYKDALDKANLVGYVAAAAAAGTAFFAYKYFKAQGDYRGQVDELRKQSRTNLEISPTTLALSIRF